jgi:hypothetical protein
MFFTAIILALGCAEFAYVLCFMDTTVGGALPFMFLSTAPLVGYIAGRVASSED